MQLNLPIAWVIRLCFWSEFNPALYRLDVTFKGKKLLDNTTLNFGMHKFSTQGTQFTINGIKTFLRGKHDACVFPLTGHPPMDVESWQKVFRIVKSYNINFYRFHSWTPPLAAFEAADIEGIYLQPELPFWGGFSKKREFRTECIFFSKKETTYLTLMEITHHL